MNVKELFTDDDAVSPVIGVILMVAITVILAAVIGAFVLNIGGSQESAPQVSWDWSDKDGTVILKHAGGDKINNPSQITVDGPGVSNKLTPDNYDNISNPTTAGDEAWISPGEDTGTIEVIWESSDGSSTNILSSHQYNVSSP